MSETAEARLKRMQMRSARRGTKEMDLVLGPYAQARLSGMGPKELTLYDRFLDENDQDLYRWVTRQAPPPDEFQPIIIDISAFLKL